MGKTRELSRRERQIMDIVFARGEATVRDICAELPDPPTDMAIRRLLQILEEKGWLKRRKEGRAVVYSPKQSRKKAGANAFNHVIDTFFGGSISDALAAHLSHKEKITPDQLKQLQDLIKAAQKQKKSE